MKIGILVSMINNFGEKGYYNSQEIGMAKALKERGHTIVVYKFIGENFVLPNNVVQDHLKVLYSHTKAIGINGLIDTSKLDKDLDALVFFADTQIIVPKIFQWCRLNNVLLIPYIGVIKSHSPSKWKSVIINSLFARNLAVYKKLTCLAKNTAVVEELKGKGVNRVLFAPVGIDIDLLNKDYWRTPIIAIKEKYGFEENDKIVLFIGRLEEEKRPIELIRAFKKLVTIDPTYRLIVVGKGVLYQEMMKEIEVNNIGDKVKYIEKIPNNNIWELYRISEAFLNLNKQEIFGMVLLEAMFYETKLVAYHAPGPDYIIENNESGILVDSETEMIEAIMKDYPEMGKKAHLRVLNSLTWSKTANLIIDLIQNQNENT